LSRDNRGSRTDVGSVIASDGVTVRIKSAITGEDGIEGACDTPHFSKRFTEGWTVGARYVSDRLRDGDTIEDIELAIKAISAAAVPRGRKRPKSLKKR
jgi:hypothetical protein